MEPREQRTHSLRRLAFPLDSVGTIGKARPAADSRGTRGAGRLSPQRVRAPGAISPAWGSGSAQGAPPPSAPGPHPTSAPPRVERRWRTPSEDTYLRGYIVSPLSYDSTSQAMGWDLSAHHRVRQRHSSAHPFTPPLGGASPQSVQ